MKEDKLKKVAAEAGREGAPSSPPSRALPPAVNIDLKALARKRLAEKYLEVISTANRGSKVKARALFIQTYNSGLIHRDIFELIGPTSWKTIERWAATCRQASSALCLTDRRGGSRRSVELTVDQVRLLLAAVLHPNRPLVSEAIRRARAAAVREGCPLDVSDGYLRSWLARWKETHYDQWVFYREGQKALNDKCLPDLQRDLNRIEVGDVVVADGHPLDFEILNPWTGKPKRMSLILWFDMKSAYPLGWEIMPTENTMAIASALRRAILCLGKMPKVLYLDNGKAFCSRFFAGASLDHLDGLFARIGVQGVIHAWKYHGQSKTVERFFRDFGELERMAPTYVGNSPTNKPPRMLRNETVHRGLYKKVLGAGGIELEQAHQAIAAWFDLYASRPHKDGHLKGQTSLAVFEAGRGPGVLELELAELMMAEEQRTVGKNGVRMWGAYYYHPALYGRRHSVTVRYDLQDRERILVYEPQTSNLKPQTLICEARPRELVHPAADYLGSPRDGEVLRDQIELKRGLEKQTIGPARQFAKDVVIPETRKALAAAGMLPRSAERGTRSATPKVIDLLEAERLAAAMVPAGPEPLSAEAEDYIEIRLRLFHGQELTEDEGIRLRDFAAGDEYRLRAREIEEALMAKIEREDEEYAQA